MEYYSHYRKSDETYQLNREHQQNTADLSERKCHVLFLKKTAYVCGLLHDGGKLTEEWLTYFLEHCKEDKRSGGEKLDHSTLGGLIAESYEQSQGIGSIFADMVRTAIFMHHGLADCISIEDGKMLAEKRKRKFSKEEVQRVKTICEMEAAESGKVHGKENDIARLCREARADVVELTKRLQQLPKDENNKNKYGSVNFYLGMCERLLFSVLGDADVQDTAAFENHRELPAEISEQEMKECWQTALTHLEQYLAELNENNKNSPLNEARKNISQQCKEAALTNHKRYRLAVPTGAGKNLSSLRFALARALETGKRHIFYVAPFRSVLEQNAADIAKAVGNKDWVLEHHGDAVPEGEEENIRYERLIENWEEVPIIATTAVQFFNTLFKEKKSNLRRFHSLCNSVIILDEI